MTRFLDVRLRPVGGDLATTVAVFQGTSLANYTELPLAQLIADVRGKHVLLVTHGFNVDREAGIARLSNWEGLLQLPPDFIFVGLLWPGDSIWAHGLDYPEEPRIANDAGQNLIAPFLDTNFGGIASLSFASHSLGVRLLLEAAAHMSLQVRRLIVMAGAIDDDCFTGEFQAPASGIEKIFVLASKEDKVLADLFPAGNLLGGIIAAGHPWFRTALGRSGPAQPAPSNVILPFEMPDDWKFSHGDYLQTSPSPSPGMSVSVASPWQALALPGAPGWQQLFSARFVRNCLS